MKKIKLFSVLSLLLVFICQISYAQDWPELKRYRQANAKLGASESQDRVVFMGNSITDFWIKKSPEFFNDNPYIDRGISGQTTPQMLIRFRPDVIQLDPKAVVILAGTNDIAGNTGPSTLGMIEDNLISMAQLAEFNHIKVILCSVLPANKYFWSPKVHPAQKIVELNKWIEQYAHENGYTYVNFYPALANEKGGMKSEYSKDGVHPNKAGYKVMEPLVEKAIHKILSSD